MLFSRNTFAKAAFIWKSLVMEIKLQIILKLFYFFIYLFILFIYLSTYFTAVLSRNFSWNVQNTWSFGLNELWSCWWWKCNWKPTYRIYFSVREPNQWAFVTIWALLLLDTGLSPFSDARFNVKFIRSKLFGVKWSMCVMKYRGFDICVEFRKGYVLYLDFFLVLEVFVWKFLLGLWESSTKAFAWM